MNKTHQKIYARQSLQVSKHYVLDGDIKNTSKYLHNHLLKDIIKRFRSNYGSN